MVELSTRRIFELWNGGVFESCDGGMDELVELSNRGTVELVDFRMVESSNG